MVSIWPVSLTCHVTNDFTTPSLTDGEERKSSNTCTTTEDSPVGCIGVLNEAVITGACSVQISGITFESSRQPFPLIIDVPWRHSSQLHACSTGQRLHCPDDPTCSYSTSDKSALLRHRQRKHDYRAKPTASKDRCMNVSKNKTEKLDDPSEDDSSPSSPLEHVTESCCPCRLSMAFESGGRAYGANDERDIWQDDDHASPPHDQGTTGMTKQTVESVERSLVEGYVTSRFPVSFARTRLPHHRHQNGALSLSASKHCRCCTSNLQTTPEITAYSSSTGSNPVSRTHAGVKVKEVVIYGRLSYLVQESASTVDGSRHNLSRTGGVLTGYSRVST